MRFVFSFLVIMASGANAQTPEIQRALIQRDQQSAEFAAGLRGPAARAALETLHARQLQEVVQPLNHPDPAVGRELAPYQRQRMADERTLVFSPPVVRAKPSEKAVKPLPLPGGPAHVVDPIPVQGTPH